MTTRTFHDWKNKWGVDKKYRDLVFKSLTFNPQSAKDISQKCGISVQIAVRALSWFRDNNDFSVEVIERINKPTMWRLKGGAE